MFPSLKVLLGLRKPYSGHSCLTSLEGFLIPLCARTGRRQCCMLSLSSDGGMELYRPTPPPLIRRAARGRPTRRSSGTSAVTPSRPRPAAPRDGMGWDGTGDPNAFLTRQLPAGLAQGRRGPRPSRMERVQPGTDPELDERALFNRDTELDQH